MILFVVLCGFCLIYSFRNYYCLFCCHRHFCLCEIHGEKIQSLSTALLFSYYLQYLLIKQSARYISSLIQNVLIKANKQTKSNPTTTSLTAKTWVLAERVRGRWPIGDDIFGVSNLGAYPLLKLEMADPRNKAVGQDRSRPAGRPVNDSLPWASFEYYDRYFSSNYDLVRSLIQVLLDTEEGFPLAWDLYLFVLLLRGAH